MRVPFVTGRELISACEYHSSIGRELIYQHASTIGHRKGANISMRVPFVTGRELISACEYHSSQEGELISACEYHSSQEGS